jgi:glucose/arabinose dehydrogenase
MRKPCFSRATACLSLLGALLTLAGCLADTEPPTATLTSPTHLSQDLSGTLTVTAQATDNDAVQAVEFEIDGNSVGEDVDAPYIATIDTTAHAGGQHIVRARARDASNNLSPWSRAVVTFAAPTPRLPAGFSKQEEWVSGLGNTSAFAQATDGRFFVCEQGGDLRVVKNGALLPTPFHQFAVDSSGQRGLLGVAVHPQFATNGWVYVYYTATTPTVRNVISRIVANGDVSTGTETLIAQLPDLGSSPNHNGGALHFGPDGKLYVGVGDNLSGAQSADPAHPFGKILRFNDDGSIPQDNPFLATNTGVAQAVWAYGLRNPFNFAFQPGTGRMHIHDVGELTWEEINLGTAGANYGWPSSEGPAGVTGNITGPLYAYMHGAADPQGSGPGGFLQGFAITGGSFYPSSGSFPPAYRNSYYFADYVSGWISRLDLDNPGDAYSFATVDGGPVDMRVGIDGALYVLKQAGSIARISAP